jgi:hypothetical protein
MDDPVCQPPLVARSRSVETRGSRPAFVLAGGVEAGTAS